MEKLDFFSDRRCKMARINWSNVLRRAAEIVDGYDSAITLRQLFYRLVAEGALPNNDNTYNRLAKTSAKARREGWFPALEDRNRSVWSPASWNGPEEAREALRQQYRRDRTEGQPVQLLVGVEKDALSGLFREWLEPYGIPLLVLKGYSSQSFKAEVTELIERDPRRTVLLYAGDHDASGYGLYRDFTGALPYVKTERVAITVEQIEEHSLPVYTGKTTDPRAADFVAEFGELVQVELDALPPEELGRIVQDAVGGYWDEAAYEITLAREDEDRKRL
jgi:hypothetical protein